MIVNPQNLKDLDKKERGVFLRRMRTEAGLTQQQAADRIGCSVQTIQKGEIGYNKLSDRMLTLAAQALAPREAESYQPPVEAVAERAADYDAVPLTVEDAVRGTIALCRDDRVTDAAERITQTLGIPLNRALELLILEKLRED